MRGYHPRRRRRWRSYENVTTTAASTRSRDDGSSGSGGGGCCCCSGDGKYPHGVLSYRTAAVVTGQLKRTRAPGSDREQYVIVRWRHRVSVRALRGGGGGVVRGRRGARKTRRARVCVRTTLACVCVRASWMNEPPVALGRSSGPFNRSPLVNRWPGGKPTVARVGGPAGRPYVRRRRFCCRCRRSVHHRDLNVHRSQVAISVDRFRSTVVIRVQMI